MSTSFSMAQAVFFDLDGTLADSLGVMRDIYESFAAKHGFRPSQEEFDFLNGPSIAEGLTYLKKEHGIVASLDSLVLSYNEAIRESYAQKVRPFDHAEPLLRMLNEMGKRLLLTTSASRDVGMGFVGHYGWQSLFYDYAFGDEVERSKPDGEIYRLACSRSNCHESSILVVEDSVNGILAARNAGLQVVGVERSGSSSESSLLGVGASKVYGRLLDILDEVHGV